MKFCISATGIKRVTISSSSGSGGKDSSLPSASTIPSRRILSSRTVLPVALLLAILLPFFFVRVAFLVLESATVCSSSLNCISGWFFSGNDGTLLREELTRALLEVKESKVNDQGLQGPLESFDELVREMTLKRHDLKAFAFRAKAMVRNAILFCFGVALPLLYAFTHYTIVSCLYQLSKMELKVHSARQRESIYWHLASHGVPKSLHCLCLKLAEEYAVNAMARSRLPLPQYVSRLADPSFHHVVLLTDNVLAASVVISSTIRSSANPEKLVFHIVTDKKTYTSMHAWFALNTINSAVVEVKGLHQYDWSQKINSGVKEMIDINRLIWKHYYNDLNEKDLEQGAVRKNLDAFTPSSLSLLNHLRTYIPELFPDLNRIVLLDDDLVVQHDLSSLWEMDLGGKVVGAVIDSWCGDECCPGRKYRNYLNFSNSIISSNFDSDQCAWLYGMNVLDLEAWRRSNITAKYLEWLKINQNNGLVLWSPGVLPPALIAFKDNVHPLDPLWHLAGLGNRFLEIGEEVLESAAVVHFSGPAKPWLEIGSPEVRSLWYKHVNFSNKFIRKCRIMA